MCVCGCWRPCAVSQDRYSVVGTPYYMSPEMIDRSPYGTGVDYWALGVLIFEAVTGCLPFTGETPRMVFAAIRKVKVPWAKLRKLRDPMLESLVMDLLCHNQADRADYMQVRHHRRTNCTPLRPSHPCAAAPSSCLQLKRHPYFYGLRWDSLSTMDIGFKPNVQLPKSIGSGSGRKLGADHVLSVSAGEVKVREPMPFPQGMALDMRTHHVLHLLAFRSGRAAHQPRRPR